MRKFILSLAFLPLLAGCGSTSVTYNITTDVDDPTRESALLFSAMRVIERRMASIGEEVRDLNLERPDGGVHIYVEAKEQAALDLLTEVLTEPFTFRVMQEASEDEAELVVEGHGGFAPTGVDKTHLQWLQASEEAGGKGRVTLSFTEEGRQKMAEVFQQNNGKYIGLFVRDQLVSKLMVETDQLKDDIIITDIPTVALANVFADDVNVGLHVTFEPIN